MFNYLWMATPDQMVTVVSEKGDADFTFILSNCKLAVKYQYQIVEAGWTSTAMFSMLADTREKLREVIKSKFNIDES